MNQQLCLYQSPEDVYRDTLKAVLAKLNFLLVVRSPIPHMIGNYNDKRQTFQDRIVMKMLDGTASPMEPWVVFTAGTMVSILK